MTGSCIPVNQLKGGLIFLILMLDQSFMDMCPFLVILTYPASNSALPSIPHTLPCAFSACPLLLVATQSLAFGVGGVLQASEGVLVEGMRHGRVKRVSWREM